MAIQIGQLVHMTHYGKRRAATLEEIGQSGMAWIRFNDTSRAQWAHAESVETGDTWGNDSVWAYESLAGLVIVASDEGRADIAQALQDGGYYNAEGEVCEALGGNGLEFIPPELLGLTEMPAFSCGLSWEGDDSDARAWDGEGQPVYGFSDYQISCPWEELQREGRVIFPKVSES